MMRSLTTLLLLFVTLVCFGQGQSAPDVHITGMVIETGTNAPLEYATISFIDSSGKIVAGGITDEKGKYNIKVPKGEYTVRFEFISYKTKQLENQRFFKNTKLRTISMSVDSENLGEVIIRAETTEVQLRLDKKIYNIGKDLTTSGATISDALDNVPSVTVDVDGTIALRGNENVRILINGKPSALAGFGSTDALRQLPAETIERVEVITSPSARYDAEGTAGILNIILRKEKTLGLNGSLQSNFRYPLGSGITGNINLRTKKFNIFNTTGVSYRESPGNATYRNFYYSPLVVNSLVTEDRSYDRTRQSFNTNLGFEYFITKSSSITATAFYREGDHNDNTTNITDEFLSSNELAVSRTRIEEELEDDSNLQFALNYVNDFDPNGHKLTIDLQWEKGEDSESGFISETNTFPINEELPSEEIYDEQEETEYLIQTDYVLPIGENAQFEAGYRGRFQNAVTDYSLYEQMEVNGAFIKNDSISNIFDYTENVQSLYTQYGNKFGDFSFLLGLRMEATTLKGDVSGEDVATDDDLNFNFDKDYLGLFPTVNLVYELNKQSNFSFGYNRRINRPRHWFINPFPSRSSEANVFQGNPNLDPAYSNAFDLGYLHKWGRKFTLTSSVYYQIEEDAFTRVQEDTGEFTSNGIPIIRTIPVNLSTNKRIGFELGILANPVKWLRLNGSFNFYQFESEGIYNDIDYGTKDDSWFARASSKVSLPAKIDWQTTAMYRGPRSNSQTKSDGMFMMNLALSKDVMNDNGTFGFNVSDLLNTRKRQSITETNTFRSESEFQWRERSFTLSFTYRFNEKKKRQRGFRNGNGDDGGGFEG